MNTCSISFSIKLTLSRESEWNILKCKRPTSGTLKLVSLDCELAFSVFVDCDSVCVVGKPVEVDCVSFCSWCEAVCFSMESVCDFWESVWDICKPVFLALDCELSVSESSSSIIVSVTRCEVCETGAALASKPKLWSNSCVAVSAVSHLQWKKGQ